MKIKLLASCLFIFISSFLSASQTTTPKQSSPICKPSGLSRSEGALTPPAAAQLARDYVLIELPKNPVFQSPNAPEQSYKGEALQYVTMKELGESLGIAKLADKMDEVFEKSDVSDLE